jgi:transposase-like protein
MNQQWTKEQCPACGSGNWIVNSLGMWDVTDYKCWSCGKEIRLCSGEHGDDFDHPHVVDESVVEYYDAHFDGLEKPE